MGQVRRRPLVAFLVAEGASLAGNKMTMLALPWLVLDTSGSLTRVGLVAFAQTGCYVLVKIAGAPWIDRLGRKRCAVAGGLASAVVLAAAPVLSHSAGLPFAALLVIVAALGAVQSITDAAKRLMVPDLVAASGAPLERVTSLYAGVERLSFLLGTPAAGLLITFLGAVNVLLLDAVAALLAALLIAVAVPAAPRPESTDGYLESLRVGLRYVRTDRLLLSISALLLFANLIDQATMAVYVPAWIKQVFDNPSLLGTIAGAYGLGAVLGSMAFAWLGPRLPRYATFAVSLLLAGSPLLFGMALTTSLPLLLGICVWAGAMSASINPIISSAMFERVPPDLHARVFGFTGSLAWAGIPLGGLLGGLVLDTLGRTPGLLLSASLYLGVTLLPLVFRRTWRELDRDELPAAVEPAAA
ncbi:putative drug antiporter protein precursor [Asanoa ishikariensis]|uniref:Predicted arabinose efflux permease, MFS family n=1 Tax=Asanoa ishikariensis TaxID=137265 RepID=A0A1H3MKK3_9ACTN|nr:putative drug antiporter protein precursor [Asanoa ishikariensis]SDY76948.1 Predicted arabinose efflux permease, MFS family [Asanoa ishikariensis]